MAKGPVNVPNEPVVVPAELWKDISRTVWRATLAGPPPPQRYEYDRKQAVNVWERMEELTK